MFVPSLTFCVYLYSLVMIELPIQVSSLTVRAAESTGIYLDHSLQISWAAFELAFQSVSFWDQYRARIIIVIAVIVFQALLIAALLFERKQRWRANQSFVESEREFSTLVKNSPDVISRLDRQLRHIYISPRFEELTGIPSDPFIGKTPNEIALTGFDWIAFENSCRDALVSKKQIERSFEFDGHTFWTRIIPEFSADGQVESVMTISEDVTERIRAEEELSDLTNRLFNLQDDERRRIARELHDGTAQNLFAISVDLVKLGQLMASDQVQARQLLAECQSLGEQSLKEIRTLSYVLHPPLLDDIGLVSATRWFVEGFSKRSGIYVDVQAHPIRRLPSDVEMALFRVIQEALTNVRRHSGSNRAAIRIETKSESVVLEIEDHGKGLKLVDDAENGHSLFSLGVGIPGMRQRLKHIGGKLEIISNDGGTTLKAIVPMTNGLDKAASSRRGLVASQV